MTLRRRSLLTAACAWPAARLARAAAARADAAAWPSAVDWAPLDAAVRAQIAASKLPGAVAVIGQAQAVRLRRAWGWRCIGQCAEPMTPDTVFDLASLTKVLATTTAVLQLAERGRIDLDARVARYWPAFASNGKHAITVRMLLSHRSGLRAGFPPGASWQGAAQGLRLLADEHPAAPPGSATLYSDLNFIALGELVRRRTGQPLDTYCRRQVFGPLRMRQTAFLPPAAWQARIAPTEAGLRGVVQDPAARRMGGVSGHAGLFSTADDLARLAQAVLAAARGRLPRWLSAASVWSMATPQGAGLQLPWRGLGWELQPPLCPNREQLAPVGTIHHTGYTGTAVWIDLVQRRYAVLLTSRLQLPGGDARALRRQVAALVSGVCAAPTLADITQAQPRWSGLAPPPAGPPRTAVSCGIDRLVGEGFGTLAGKRVGLVTNLSAIDAHGWRTLDRLRWARGVELAQVFSPEHGLYGDLEGPVASGTEALSGLPLVSLYSSTRRLQPQMLQGLDALVYDIQDAGARFFTYVTTMGRAMEAAAAAGLPFLVLDRPNPIRADRVGGPVLDAGRESFTAFTRLPVQHGMTTAELARLFARDIEDRLGHAVQLHVLPLSGYRRSMWFDETGLDWVPPSPNLHTPETAVLYPGVAWVEGAGVSVGRGTPRPFSLVGAPWIDAQRWLRVLTQYALAGLSLDPAAFVPSASTHAGQRCEGLSIRVHRRDEVDASLLGLALVKSLFDTWPQQFPLERTLELIGSQETVDAIRVGRPWAEIVEAWQPGIQAFLQRRGACLLY